MSIASELEQVAMNLNSALAEINDKLTTKGGTASSTVYGVVAAVENLPSGGEDENIIFTTRNGNGYFSVGEKRSFSWNGALTNSNGSNYAFAYGNKTQWRIVYKCKITTDNKSNYPVFWGNSGDSIDNSNTTMLYQAPSGSLNFNHRNIDGQKPGQKFKNANADTEFIPELNKWYYIVCCWLNGVLWGLIFDDNLNVVGNILPSQTKRMYLNGTATKIGIRAGSNAGLIGQIDLQNTLFETNNVIGWGNSTSLTNGLGKENFGFSNWNSFTEVEYISSTASTGQYIDLLAGLENDDFEIDFEIKTDGRYSAIFSYGWGSNYGHCYVNGGIAVWDDGLKGKITPESYDDWLVCKLTRGGNNYTLSVNGQTATFTDSHSFGNTIPLTLFTRYDNGFDNGVFSLRKFKVKKAGELIRDLYPCYHSTYTNFVGLFDKINNQFFGNLGTGTFLKGADVN